MNTQIFTEDIGKLLLGAVLGGIIGMERQWSGKAAGFRTVMLVSLGATLFTLMSYRVPGLPTGDRIASTIVTGIGFIGAGLIFKGDQTIHGLTTAATVWAAAAVGMAAGYGSYELAIGATALIWFVLMILHKLEVAVEKRWEVRRYKIKYTYRSGDTLFQYDDFFNNSDFTLLKAKTEKNNDVAISTWTVRASESKHDEVIKKMLENGRIKEIDY